MILALVIIFGAIIGVICFAIKGSGYGVLWDITFGIAGYILSSFLMTASYLMNGFGKADVMGINWYSIIIGTVGSLVTIYGMWLYKRADLKH